MNPEKLQRLQACLEEAASILYEETPASELQDLESIEKAVRAHLLQRVGPSVAIFLSGKRQEQNKVESGG